MRWLLITVIILLVVVGVVYGISRESAPEVYRDSTTPLPADAEKSIQETSPGAQEAVQEIVQGKTPLLFFYAAWCPTCRSLDQEIQNRQQEIPDHIAVVNVFYDKEKDLRRHYNVTRQHTLVLLDKNLEATATWVGGGVDDILANINR